MKLPGFVIWAIIGAGLVAIGALNVNVGRRAKDSLAPWLFQLAWLIMWSLILLGSWITFHALFIMEH
ncbi:MAG: hypothetical protein H7A35_03105 [Planctomycetales bacterium]|nr:hypothetical protein [bacterium]UNM09046.1 MAG: hypothetical protein H7A35_03105 [Planctomycetales bacterium]